MSPVSAVISLGGDEADLSPSHNISDDVIVEEKEEGGKEEGEAASNAVVCTASSLCHLCAFEQQCSSRALTDGAC